MFFLLLLFFCGNRKNFCDGGDDSFSFIETFSNLFYVSLSFIAVIWIFCNLWFIFYVKRSILCNLSQPKTGFVYQIYCCGSNILETTLHKDIVLLLHFQLNNVLNDLTHSDLQLKTVLPHY